MELKVVTRNAGEILRLHENFVDELRDAVSLPELLAILNESQHGQHMDWDQGNAEVPATEYIDEAIRVVSTKFAVEVRDTFDILPSSADNEAHSLVILGL